LPSVITPCGGAASAFKGCRVYNSADITLPNGTWTKLAFDTEHYDYGGYHSTVTNTGRLTVPAGLGGLYTVFASVWFSVNVTGFRLFQATKNGEAINTDPVLYEDRAAYATTLGTQVIAMAAGPWEFVAGDYLELQAFQDSGSTLTVLHIARVSPMFGLTYEGAP
jgi:hypothetical protein